MERRASSRSPVSVNVFIPVAGKPYNVCKTINLSSRGVYLSADSSVFPVDEPIPLFFTVTKHQGTVIQVHPMSAKVVRFGARGVGLIFCRQSKTKTQAFPQHSTATISMMKR